MQHTVVSHSMFYHKRHKHYTKFKSQKHNKSLKPLYFGIL